MKPYTHRAILRIYLRIIIPSILIWLSVFTFTQYRESQMALKNTIQLQNADHYSASIILQHHFHEIHEDLLIKQQAPAIRTYLQHPTPDNYDVLEKYVADTMQVKTQYGRIRLWNRDSEEILTMDSADICCTMPTDATFPTMSCLQEALKLDAHEIFITPMDASNSEHSHGTVHPFIKFSTPIGDADQQILGVIAVHYSTKSFLNLLLHEPSEDILHPHQSIIIDQSGYIAYVDESIADSMAPGDDFVRAYPDIWSALQSGDNGHIRKDNNIFIYYDVLDGVREIHPDYQDHWYIIDIIPTHHYFNIHILLHNLLQWQQFLLFAVLNIVAVGAAVTFVKARYTDNRLLVAQMIADKTQEAIIITDADTRITYVNKAYEKATGYQMDEVMGEKPSKYKSGKHDKAFYEAMWQDIVQQGHWEGHLWDKKKDGLLYPKKLLILAVKSRTNGPVTGYVGVFTDLSAAQPTAENLMADITQRRNDPAPNEQLLIDLMQKSLENPDSMYLLLSISIENYNQLLSLVGESQYQEVPRIFVQLIQPALNENDFVAQTGRNQFTAMIQMKLDESPQDHMKSIIRDLSRVVTLDGVRIFYRVKIGVSVWPLDTQDLRHLLLHALIALDWSITRQPADYSIFDPSMIQTLSEETRLEGYLRQALEKKEFHLVYQPQVNAETLEITGMEALLRWENHELGIIPPGRFIPIAERIQMIIDIGYWVIQQTCRDITELIQSGLDLHPQFRCAINLSALQLQESDFVDRTLQILQNFTLDNHLIEMEITESILLNNPAQTVAIIQQFHDMGITIALDDFGTGYSSLSYLNTLPIDKIKIDRSFIQDYPEQNDGKLAGILVDMSHALDIAVLTEGAETLQQVQYLRSRGCNTIQGYYFSAPLRFSALIQYITKHTSGK